MCSRNTPLVTALPREARAMPFEIQLHLINLRRKAMNQNSEWSMARPILHPKAIKNR